MNAAHIEIIPYTPDMEPQWNAFVARSKNGTFLFDRRYMDYHADRFTDASLTFCRRGRIVALMPGNVEGEVFYTHRGLTYGGLVTDSRATAGAVVTMMRMLASRLRRAGIERMVYKPVPYIYHRIPAQEDLYALFAMGGATLSGRSISSAIDLSARLPLAESRRSGLRKAVRAGVEITESADFAAFWQILADNLRLRHGVSPVHSLEEISRLAAAWPDRIRLHAAMLGGRMLGATVVYDTGRTVHTQYISASPEGKSLGALDLLLHTLITRAYAAKAWFDFGGSTEQMGRRLNSGLIFQKEGFGARGVCYDTYEIDLTIPE